MFKPDALEAAGIVDRFLGNLAACIAPTSGLVGAQARMVINATRVNAEALLVADAIGPPLDSCFDLTRQAGATLPQIESVRLAIDDETPASLGAVLIQNSGIGLCLATEGAIIADMTFTSRQDVQALVTALVEPFGDAEEIAADDMDQMTYQALIGLHASIVNHLVTTARPLPRMVAYQFFKTMPSLVIAYRLYADASRADQVRAENKIVHPAFCPLAGQALSF